MNANSSLKFVQHSQQATGKLNRLDLVIRLIQIQNLFLFKVLMDQSNKDEKNKQKSKDTDHFIHYCTYVDLKFTVLLKISKRNRAIARTFRCFAIRQNRKKKPGIISFGFISSLFYGKIEKKIIENCYLNANSSKFS